MALQFRGFPERDRKPRDYSDILTPLAALGQGVQGYLNEGIRDRQTALQEAENARQGAAERRQQMLFERQYSPMGMPQSAATPGSYPQMADAGVADYQPVLTQPTPQKSNLVTQWEQQYGPKMGQSRADYAEQLGYQEKGLGMQKTRAEIERELAEAQKARRYRPGSELMQVKPPAGYRYTSEGNLEAIPGGPAFLKGEEKNLRQQSQQKAAMDQADRLIMKVDQALSKVGLSSAGPGSYLSSIPGTNARNLASDLQTIKANLGFSELQAMRAASPTGGALGQIAVQELQALQSTLASLDQAQSPDQLSSRLGEIKQHFENWKQAVQGAGAENESIQIPQGGQDMTKTLNGKTYQKINGQWFEQ